MKLITEIKKILISRTDKLGDTILSLPVVSDIKNAFPNIEIDFLCSPNWKDLVQSDASINNVICWKKGMETINLITTLKKNKYDAVIVLYPRPASLVNAFIEAKIPIRVGSGRRLSNFFKFNYKTYESRRDGNQHECAYNRLIGQKFINIFMKEMNVLNKRPKWNFIFSEKDIKWAEAKLLELKIDSKFIIIQVGSDDTSPNWPIEYNAKLIDLLAKKGVSSLVHIGPGEEHLLEKLNSHCKTKVLSIQKASLPELGAIIKRSSLIVSPSTGPLHLASALNTNIVGIYPPIFGLLPHRWGPLSSQNRVFVPTLKNGKPYKKRNKASDNCMHEISVEVVLAAVEELLTENI